MDGNLSEVNNERDGDERLRIDDGNPLEMEHLRPDGGEPENTENSGSSASKHSISFHAPDGSNIYATNGYKRKLGSCSHIDRFKVSTDIALELLASVVDFLTKEGRDAISLKLSAPNIQHSLNSKILVSPKPLISRASPDQLRLDISLGRPRPEKENKNIGTGNTLGPIVESALAFLATEDVSKSFQRTNGSNRTS